MLRATRAINGSLASKGVHTDPRNGSPGLAGLENLRACLCDRHRLTFRPGIGECAVAKRHAGGIHDRLLVHYQRADFARESPIEYTTNARQRTEQPDCATMLTTRAQQRCVLENGVTH